jgi:hypothetical protein
MARYQRLAITTIFCEYTQQFEEQKSTPINFFSGVLNVEYLHI